MFFSCYYCRLYQRTLAKDGWYWLNAQKLAEKMVRYLELQQFLMFVKFYIFCSWKMSVSIIIIYLPNRRYCKTFLQAWGLQKLLVDAWLEHNCIQGLSRPQKFWFRIKAKNYIWKGAAVIVLATQHPKCTSFIIIFCASI